MLALDTITVTEVPAAQLYEFYRSQGENIDPRAHGCRCYATCVGDTIVSAAVVLLDTPLNRWRIDRRGDVISSVLTVPEARGEGHARRLMNHVLASHPEVYLSVELDNAEARKLYDSLGFFVYKNAEDRVIMKIDPTVQRDIADGQSRQNDLMEIASTRHPGFGYVSAKLNPRQGRTLYDTLVRLGLKKPLMPEKYHVTLMYDRDNPMQHVKRDVHRVFRASMTDYDVMGEGKWRAIVIHLDSPALDVRHAELKQLGMTHSYPDYRCHLSLKYTPSDADVAVIRENIDHIRDLFSAGLMFERETWEPIEE